MGEPSVRRLDGLTQEELSRELNKSIVNAGTGSPPEHLGNCKPAKKNRWVCEEVAIAPKPIFSMPGYFSECKSTKNGKWLCKKIIPKNGTVHSVRIDDMQNKIKTREKDEKRWPFLGGEIVFTPNPLEEQPFLKWVR